MSNKTVVSTYVQEKFNKIEKDLFLKEISNLSKTKQKNALIKEINAIEYYIQIIKSNRNCYIKIDNKKVLRNNVKKYLIYLKGIIKKYQEYYKYINMLECYEDKKQRIDKKIEFESSTIVLNYNQIEILNELDITNIDYYDFNDLVSIVKYLIQHFDMHKTTIIKLILDKIEQDFINSNYSENKFVAINGIKNILTYKINCLDKNDNGRKFLREIKKYVKSIINLSKEQEIKNHDYRIDIINILLDDERYLSKLITICPNFLNLLDEENHTFAYTLITKYLDLYFLELQGKQNQTKKEKYLKMYYKLSQSPNYLYNEIDQIEIKTLLNNFREMIKNGNFKRKKYLEVCNMLNSILNNNYKEVVKKDYNKDVITFEKDNILNLNLCEKRKNLQEEYTIVISDSQESIYNYAYSIVKKDSRTYLLHLHITDVSTFIEKNSYLDNALKDTMFAENRDWLEENLLKKFSLVKGKEKPVVTLECELKDNKISDFRCYKSTIVVDDIYSIEDFNNKLLDKRILEYLKLGYLLNKNFDNNNCGRSLVETFDNCFINQVGTYFDEHKFPYIYKKQKTQNNNNYIELLEKLNCLFGKIKKEDANIFYSIICEDINCSKYSIEPNYNSEFKQRYHTDLLVPLYSYIGIYLQYLLDDFLIKKDLNRDVLKENYKEEIKDLVNYANVKEDEKIVNKQKKFKI